MYIVYFRFCLELRGMAKGKRKKILNAGKEVFVGRQKELEQFKEALKDPAGQAVVVVGHRGMGKTWLINKMARIAESDGQLKCGWVRYEVTPNDMPDSTMALMIDHAFEAAQIEAGSFNGTPKRLAQWRAFLNVFKIGDLVMSLRRDQQRNTRDQFLKRLEIISKHMSENGRALFVIDPEKYMRKDSDQDWAIVVKDLPEKIKLVFAQRTEDVLVKSETFGRLTNVVHIPGEWLGELEEEAVGELINLRANEVGATEKDLRDALAKYKGHPYAIQGALDLVKEGIDLDQLPQDTAGIAQAQWRKVCDIDKDAIKLFKAYAILEIAVPDEVVQVVSELDLDTRQHLLADDYLAGLLRKESDGWRIYHTILADYILEKMPESEKKKYNVRAMEVYRKQILKAAKLEIPSDGYMAGLGAKRLPYHALNVDGINGFVRAAIDECMEVLRKLGYLLEAKSLGARVAEVKTLSSEDVVSLTKKLALICTDLGEISRAEIFIREGLKDALIEGRDDDKRSFEFMLAEILVVCGKLTEAEEIYRSLLEYCDIESHDENKISILENLGVVYWRQGLLDEAEEVLYKALQISERFGDEEYKAGVYGNLGMICLSRGDILKADKMISEALKYAKALDEILRLCSNHVYIYITLGRLDEAEEKLQDILTINKQMGNMEGIARSYANIGSVFEKRGDKEKTREYWNKSLELYEHMGMTHEASEVQGWICGLEEKRTDNR